MGPGEILPRWIGCLFPDVVLEVWWGERLGGDASAGRRSADSSVVGLRGRRELRLVVRRWGWKGRLNSASVKGTFGRFPVSHDSRSLIHSGNSVATTQVLSAHPPPLDSRRNPLGVGPQRAKSVPYRGRAKSAGWIQRWLLERRVRSSTAYGGSGEESMESGLLTRVPAYWSLRARCTRGLRTCVRSPVGREGGSYDAVGERGGTSSARLVGCMMDGASGWGRRESASERCVWRDGWSESEERDYACDSRGREQYVFEKGGHGGGRVAGCLCTRAWQRRQVRPGAGVDRGLARGAPSCGPMKVWTKEGGRQGGRECGDKSLCYGIDPRMGVGFDEGAGDGGVVLGARTDGWANARVGATTAAAVNAEGFYMEWHARMSAE
ncbi:hypothetical protein DFP72DRAFT_1047369 [Ephemerocybe angulata]|uniref:Uncharacterized protein n=1 Tax=Ephemerocybe angulata TaxID=980116 RepID=A0A8H6M3M7_9AGAR|nr:hypothetical protein DFP72DRAFT_1047369 [Tulosesus angulatus]